MLTFFLLLYTSMLDILKEKGDPLDLNVLVLDDFPEAINKFPHFFQTPNILVNFFLQILNNLIFLFQNQFQINEVLPEPLIFSELDLLQWQFELFHPAGNIDNDEQLLIFNLKMFLDIVAHQEGIKFFNIFK